MAIMLHDTAERNDKEYVKSHTVKFHIAPRVCWGESLGILKVRAMAVSERNVKEDREAGA